MKRSNKPYLFISFSATQWNGPWYVRQKLMNEFAKTEKVIYVNPRLEIREVFKLLYKPKNWFKNFLGIRKINNNLILVESVWLFPKFYKFKLLDIALNRFYHFFIQCIATVWGRGCLEILYIWEPDFADFITYYHHFPYVYHPYDMFEKYSSVSSAQINEVELARNASIFYTVSNLLREHYKKKVGRKPSLILNGVDEVYFQKEIDANLEKSATAILAKFDKKKIVYFGSIKGVLNLDIVISSSAGLADYDIIFIGELRYLGIAEFDQKISQLFFRDNIHHIGPFAVEILPYLLRQVDILIMLYGQDPRFWTYYAGPAKLFECMAMGKPIISTPHPSLTNFQKYIKIVNTPDDFIRVVNNATEIGRASCRERV